MSDGWRKLPSVVAATGCALALGAVGYPAFRVAGGIDDQTALYGVPPEKTSSFVAAVTELPLFEEPERPTGLTLPSAPGADVEINLAVTSEPPGGKVRIDGSTRGTTPFLGSHVCKVGTQIEISILHAGYKEWKERRACVPEQAARIKATLLKRK